MTIEEQERYAHARGDTALAAALARVIDLENEAADLRAVIRDAVDLIDQDITDWRARATALGSNPNPRADASTSRVALLSATEARSHASAASALASSARSVDMVCPAERTASLLRRECVNCRHGRGL